MGQKIGVLADGYSEDSESQVNLEEIEVERMNRLLEIKFSCSFCKTSWNSKFSENGTQECLKCSTKNKGKVSLPKGHHLIGFCECQKCDLKWERPIPPTKSLKLKCVKCGSVCPVIKFSISDESSYEKTKYVSEMKKKKDDDTDENEKVEVITDKEEEKEEVIMDEEEDGLENVKTCCKICFENEVEICLVPCGHTICKDCSGKVSKCPFDRKVIMNRITLFML